MVRYSNISEWKCWRGCSVQGVSVQKGQVSEGVEWWRKLSVQGCWASKNVGRPRGRVSKKVGWPRGLVANMVECRRSEWPRRLLTAMICEFRSRVDCTILINFVLFQTKHLIINRRDWFLAKKVNISNILMNLLRGWRFNSRCKPVSLNRDYWESLHWKDILICRPHRARTFSYTSYLKLVRTFWRFK